MKGKVLCTSMELPLCRDGAQRWCVVSTLVKMLIHLLWLQCETCSAVLAASRDT